VYALRSNTADGCSRSRRRRIPLLVEPGLDEINVGALEGATIDEYGDWKRQHSAGEAFPSGESIDDAMRRYAQALRSLLERLEQRFLVVCHEAAIRSMLDALDGRGWRHVPNATPYVSRRTLSVPLRFV
jgi:broad specificity phosphatase PhoE